MATTKPRLAFATPRLRSLPFARSSSAYTPSFGLVRHCSLRCLQSGRPVLVRSRAWWRLGQAARPSDETTPACGPAHRRPSGSRSRAGACHEALPGPSHDRTSEVTSRTVASPSSRDTWVHTAPTSGSSKLKACRIVRPRSQSRPTGLGTRRGGSSPFALARLLLADGLLRLFVELEALSH